MSDLGELRDDIAVFVGPLWVGLILILAQLALFITAVVFVLTGQWVGLAVAAGLYALTMAMRWMLSRRIGRLQVHVDGIALVDRARTQSWRWSELASFEYGVLTLRDGTRRRLVESGSAKLDGFEQAFLQHGLEAARARLARGESVRLFGGELVVRSDGFERRGAFRTWDAVAVHGDDKLLSLAPAPGDPLTERSGSLYLVVSTTMIPDTAILKDQLAAHGVEIRPRPADA